MPVPRAAIEALIRERGDLSATIVGRPWLREERSTEVRVHLDRGNASPLRGGFQRMTFAASETWTWVDAQFERSEYAYILEDARSGREMIAWHRHLRSGGHAEPHLHVGMGAGALIDSFQKRTCRPASCRLRMSSVSSRETSVFAICDPAPRQSSNARATTVDRAPSACSGRARSSCPSLRR